MAGSTHCIPPSPTMNPSAPPTRFPKNKVRILLLENVHQRAIDMFHQEGFYVETATALSKEELLDKLAGRNGHEAIHAIGVRSKTVLSAECFELAKRLLCVGCYCIGTDNHDLPKAEQCGIPIFNAPFANTRSVAELVITEIIALSRQLMDRSAECHRGGWYKVSKGCCEVRGKTLGIVGYGHVGSQVSVLAESLGMRVVYHDVIPKMALGNASQCGSMEEVLEQADYVTLHVPRLPSTKNLIGAAQLAAMKKGSYLINAARGEVVVVDDLAEALRSGHLAGAAADVFPSEPKKNGEELFESPLCGLPNVILTPHIGGSTEEAQAAIGVEVASAMIKCINTGVTYGAVNFPQVDIMPRVGTHRLINCHRNVPGVLMKVNTALSQAGCNIFAQQLTTSETVGYMVVDVDVFTSEECMTIIKSLGESIRSRILWAQ